MRTGHEPETPSDMAGDPDENHAHNPESPVSQQSEGYEEMLDRHHESLIEVTRAATKLERTDSLFASSVQNLREWQLQLIAIKMT